MAFALGTGLRSPKPPTTISQSEELSFIATFGFARPAKKSAPGIGIRVRILNQILLPLRNRSPSWIDTRGQEHHPRGAFIEYRHGILGPAPHHAALENNFFDLRSARALLEE